MNLLITLDHRFISTTNQQIWTVSTYDYDFFAKYLTVFDKVFVIARVEENVNPLDSYRIASGKNVEFIPIPTYIGPWQFIMKYPRIRKILRSIKIDNDAIISRVPSTIGNLFLKRVMKNGHPFAVEVIGDPHGVLSRGSINHAFRIIFKWWFTSSMKRQCKHAVAASYVTDKALQERYPNKSFTIGISSIMLPDEAFINKPRPIQEHKDKFTIIFIGYLELLVKAPDVLIDAAAICVRKGMDIELRVIGDGRKRDELCRRKSAIFLGKKLHFLGRLQPGNAIIEELDMADLFILPSRQEGLPKAMIEAMARGLPCIGTKVGGIPELLNEDFLVQPDDAEALAEKIIQVLGDPFLMSNASAINLERAEDFRIGALSEKRHYFYQYIESATLIDK